MNVVLAFFKLKSERINEESAKGRYSRAFKVCRVYSRLGMARNMASTNKRKMRNIQRLKDVSPNRKEIEQRAAIATRAKARGRRVCCMVLSKRLMLPSEKNFFQPSV